MTKQSVKNQLIEVSRDYLGPAAERFVDRQISTHLKKDVEMITAADVKELIEWIKLSFALLTKNTGLVDEYIQRIALIADGQSAQALGKQWQK